jgi:hypothetical protein
MSRDLDVAVAERVLGMHVERIKPAWYPLEVTLFYWPNDPLITYSYDANACNAMMYRNGKDDTAGTAPPLPRYSGDLSAAWEVIAAMKRHPTWSQFDTALVAANVWRLDSEEAATAICEVALKAVSSEVTQP